MGRRVSHRLCVEPAGSHTCYNQDGHTGAGGGTGLSPGWARGGLHRASDLSKCAMGGQSGRKDQDSDSAAHLPLPRAFAAMVGTWLDQVQGLGQPLPFARFEVEQALVPLNSSASHLVHHAQNLCLQLQHLEPTEATPQGEGD